MLQSILVIMKWLRYLHTNQHVPILIQNAVSNGDLNTIKFIDQGLKYITVNLPVKSIEVLKYILSINECIDPFNAKSCKSQNEYELE